MVNRMGEELYDGTAPRTCSMVDNIRLGSLEMLALSNSQGEKQH